MSDFSKSSSNTLTADMALNHIQQQLSGNVIVLVGAPLSGKGTQGARLAKALDRPYGSTGDLFRNEVASGSTLGQQMKTYMNAGELIPNELTTTFLTTKFNDPIYQKGMILDGYPRNPSHLSIFENILINLDREIFVAIYLDVAKAQLDERRTQRGRVDDSVDTSERRYVVFQQETVPLIDLLESRNLLIKINCIAESPEDIHQRILSELATFEQQKLTYLDSYQWLDSSGRIHHKQNLGILLYICSSFVLICRVLSGLLNRNLEFWFNKYILASGSYALVEVVWVLFLK